MRPLIHIGYHKTGSTWLQTQIFRPEMGFAPFLTQGQIDDVFVTPHALQFDPKTARTVVSGTTQSTELVPVLSSENLTGHPFFGGRDSAAIAHRLCAAIPQATILIVVRAQTTILPSIYMQYLKRGGTLAPKQFFLKPTGVNYPGFATEHFEFDRLIGLYQSLFSQVIVMTYEQLVRDPDAFAAHLLSKAGCPPKPLAPTQYEHVSRSPPTGAIPLIRMANRFRRSTLNPNPALALGREAGTFDRMLFPVARRMPNAPHVANLVKRELAPLYTQSNAKLSHLTHGSLDLSQYP